MLSTKTAHFINNKTLKNLLTRKGFLSKLYKTKLKEDKSLEGQSISDSYLRTTDTNKDLCLKLK